MYADNSNHFNKWVFIAGIRGRLQFFVLLDVFWPCFSQDPSSNTSLAQDLPAGASFLSLHATIDSVWQWVQLCNCAKVWRRRVIAVGSCSVFLGGPHVSSGILARVVEEVGIEEEWLKVVLKREGCTSTYRPRDMRYAWIGRLGFKHSWASSEEQLYLHTKRCKSH